MIYQIIGAMQMGEARRVDGKNADASWWYIIFPGGIEGHAWVASSVTTPNCMNDTLPVISTSSLPAPYQAAVTNLVVGVDPTGVDVEGCVGEGKRMTAYATVSVSGPMVVTYSFEIDGGQTESRTATFNGMGSREVTQSFKSGGTEGNHWVRLWVDGVDVTAFPYQARYKVTCVPPGP